MEIKQIQYFLAVAKVGSFSIAADDLFISQSSLSKQIIALEKELACSLFNRSRRKITLTDAGQTFHQHAVQINDIYKKLTSDLEKFATVTTLSIASIPVIAQYGISISIARFRIAYPNINLVLEEKEASAILPALIEERYDLAFVRDNYLDKDLFEFVEICKDQLIIMVSRKHSFAQRSRVSLQELANENFILFDKGTVVRELSVEACRKAGYDPQVCYSSSRVESILSMVASNVGVTLMMKRVSDYHQHPDVVSIPMEELITSNLVIAYLKNKRISKSARIFIDLIEKQAFENEQGL
jgi:LysR family transcriptional regulator, transcription activator of glutamate synthase operon